MRKATTSVKVAALTAASALLLAACGGSEGGDEPNASGAAGGTPTKGGTLTILYSGTEFNSLDPQVNYTGEDVAIAGAYITRSLTSFTPSADPAVAGKLSPDLATDTGTPSPDGKTWTFTLKDGIKFEDGAPITCEDVKYGISRTFATDVIQGGPIYAITMLDVPTAEDGSSQYKGPYTGEGQELFDAAVTCSDDGKVITFKLARPIADFNYSTSFPAYGPVPKAADEGAKYELHPVATGPYKIESMTTGDSLVMVRNDQWDQATDTIRHAYPDKVVVNFGVDPSISSQRMVADAAADQTAIAYDDVDPAQLAAVFNDPKFENRRYNYVDVFVRYAAVNTEKVPNVKHRQALAAAMPRATIRTIAGGNFAGDLADGVIKPNLTEDYQPTGLWTGLLGQAIPDDGDPEYAKKLIAESGEPMPKITYDYAKTDTNDKVAGAIVDALQKAGIDAAANPMEPGGYYGIVFDPKKAHELIRNGWGADWPNASTVVPEVFAGNGGWNVSAWDDEAFTKASDEAKTIADRAEQGQAWADLNKQAVQQAVIIPWLFERAQRMHGSKVGGAYPWAPLGSWGYMDLYVKQ